MHEKNPLSPHLQIYEWQISSLLSIAHRTVGVINTIAITFICLWTILLLFGESNYSVVKNFFQSFFGKFIIICLSWSFSFHALNEIRHLMWDLGYGFDPKTSKITGVITVIGSLVLTILIFLFGRGLT